MQATGTNNSCNSGRIRHCAAAAVRRRSHLKCYCSESAVDAAVAARSSVTVLPPYVTSILKRVN